MQRLLLDTCAFIWLATGDGRLSRFAREAISAADCVFVSPISAWEIGQKHRQGKLRLPMTPQKLFDAVVERYALDVAPLDTAIMFKASMLAEHHKDPADRFIIATALLNGLTVVTADRRFPEYGVYVVA